MSKTDDRKTPVRIRRAPKFSVFLILGAVVGLFVSLIVTASFPADPTVGIGPILGYFAIYGLVGGVLVGAVVALIFDRALGRRAKTATVEVDRLQVSSDDSGTDGQ